MAMQDSSVSEGANPSRWAHRAPPIILALAGFGIALYLALYQWGAFPHVWEPLFGAGSVRILHSAIAKSLPVPDASLGAAGYLIEALLGALGGASRWRRHPWLVLLYGLTVLGFFIGSGALLLLQIFYFQTGCLLCLASAAISIVIAIIAPAEPLAALRAVRKQHARGLSYLAALRGGGDAAGAREPQPTRHAGRQM